AAASRALRGDRRPADVAPRKEAGVPAGRGIAGVAGREAVGAEAKGQPCRLAERMFKPRLCRVAFAILEMIQAVIEQRTTGRQAKLSARSEGLRHRAAKPHRADERFLPVPTLRDARFQADLAPAEVKLGRRGKIEDDVVNLASAIEVRRAA